MTQATVALRNVEPEERTRPEPDVREQIAATRAAVLAAHDAPVREAAEGLPWQRVGLFRRLRREE